VKTFFTAPTAFRAIKKEDPQAEFLRKYDISSLKYLFLAGERLDPPTYHWLKERLPNIPVIDHWWQTESGWPMACNPMGIEPLPVKPGSPSVAVPGYDIRALDDEGNEVATGKIGAIVVKLPLPPGTLPTLWHADERFRESYLSRYPGYYLTADAGFIDEDRYISIMSRIDDIINVAGHRLSTGAMEEVLAGHPDVAECAVIGVADQLKGQLPVGFLCLSKGVDRNPDEIAGECVKRVRDEIGPVAAFKKVIVVDRLPKTRSGKILRRTMVQIADGEEFRMPATIDDPAIIDEIRDAVTQHGLGKRA
jgi:propionyl-CoA synthetase